MQQKLETDRTQSNKGKKQKKGPEIYGPEAGFSKFLEHKMQVDFVIGEQKEKNQIVLKILLGREKQCIKIQLFSEADLFFYYQILITHSDALHLSARFSMQVRELADLALMLEKNLNQVLKGEKKIVFQVQTESSLQFVITKYINHKNFLVFSLELQKLSSYECNQLAAFRYGSLRQEVADFQIRINELKQIIKSKNPYLLSFINKI